MTNINGGTDGNDVIGGEACCLALLYDKNGTGLPNTLGKDITERGLTIVTPPEPKAILGEVKIMTNAFNDKTKNGDYWLRAKEYCESEGLRLPTEAELVSIANALYIGLNVSATSTSYTYAGKDANGEYYRIGSNEPIPDALSGLGTSWYTLWAQNTHSRNFTFTWTNRTNSNCTLSMVRAICVAD